MPNGHARIGISVYAKLVFAHRTTADSLFDDWNAIRVSRQTQVNSRSFWLARILLPPALGRARRTFGGAMPPKKKKAAAPKKEEAVPALSEEERLVLAQAEALKVRGGCGRERLFSFRLALDYPKRSTRRLPPSPRASDARDPR
jgi:hypothetical protein